MHITLRNRPLDLQKNIYSKCHISHGACVCWLPFAWQRHRIDLELSHRIDSEIRQTMDRLKTENGLSTHPFRAHFVRCVGISIVVRLVIVWIRLRWIECDRTLWPRTASIFPTAHHQFRWHFTRFRFAILIANDIGHFVVVGFLWRPICRRRWRSCFCRRNKWHCKFVRDKRSFYTRNWRCRQKKYVSESDGERFKLNGICFDVDGKRLQQCVHDFIYGLTKTEEFCTVCMTNARLFIVCFDYKSNSWMRFFLAAMFFLRLQQMATVPVGSCGSRL